MADSAEDTQDWAKIPAIDLALLEYLERREVSWFPTLDTPDRKIWYQAGRRSFVQFLRQVYNFQNNVQQ